MKRRYNIRWIFVWREKRSVLMEFPVACFLALFFEEDGGNDAGRKASNVMQRTAL